MSSTPSSAVGIGGRILAQGFAVAVALWCAWYSTHIPWLGLSEQVRLPVLLLTWLGMCIWASTTPGGRPVTTGAGAGFIAALVGLLLLGAKLAPPQGSAPVPQMALVVVGFLVAGLAIGLIGGGIGAAIGPRPGPAPDWLARLGLIAAIAVAPLVFVGGLVTSTNSGMAVPDWPNTYGANMFLYPLGPRVGPDVFFEHSHRLFGTLVGLTTLVLTGWVLRAEGRRWVKTFAVVTFLLVVFQGILGGVRVRMGHKDPNLDLRAFALAHGVLAQLTFGCVVALATFLSPTFKLASPTAGPIPGLRRMRFFTTGALHSTLLQLLFGAMYRHFRDMHSMWTHAGFSIVVLVMALMAGFASGTLPDEPTGIARIIRRCGRWMLIAVIVQFLLGWTTFSLGGRELKAATSAQALLRTAHQANGALLLAATAAAFFWTRKLLRLSEAPAPERR